MFSSTYHKLLICVTVVLLSVAYNNNNLLLISAQSTTCAIDSAITLATLSPLNLNHTILSLDPATLALKTEQVSLGVGFCSSIQPSNAGLGSSANCAANGYVTLTNATSGQCIASYNTISSTLAYATSLSVSSIVSTTNSINGDFQNSNVNVTITCNSSMSATAISLVENITYTTSTKTWLLHFQSGAPCNSSTLFCTSNTDCTDTGKTCQNGVCFNAGCAQLTEITKPFENQNSGVLAQFSVADCSGTPLPNLTSTDFDVLLNGVSAKGSSQFSSESDMYVQSNPQSQPSLSILLIDQSASVTQNAVSLAAVKAAANRFVDLVQGQNNFHYIAIIAFDGSTAPLVVVEHTLNTTDLKAGIDAFPPAGLNDPGSTNLNGAVRDAVRIANAMRFSFGPLNTSVASTLIVFTDGYDTSARRTQFEAITAVQGEIDKVRVVGVGVASTSDHIFLQSISTSGIFYFSTDVSTISTSFESIAQRLATAGQSVYAVGICQPLRSSNVTASFLLNTSVYTTTQGQSVTFDASQMTGGCTNNTLASDLNLLALNYTSTTNQTEALAIGSPLSYTIDPRGAVFFTFSCAATNDPAVVFVSPTTVQLFSLNSTTTRCSRVSPYCFDSQITTGSGSFTCAGTTGMTYTLMALPDIEATSATSITLSAVPASGITPTPVTPGTPVGTTATPSPGSAAAAATTTFDLFNASSYSSVGESHIDTPGAWIIFGFLIFGLFAAFIYNSYNYVYRVGPALVQEEEMSRTRAVKQSLRSTHWSSNASRMTADQRVLDKPLIIYANANSPYMVNNQTSPHRQHFFDSRNGGSTVSLMRNPNSPQRGVGNSMGNGGFDNNYDQHRLSPSAENLSPLFRSKQRRGFVPV